MIKIIKSKKVHSFFENNEKMFNSFMTLMQHVKYNLKKNKFLIFIYKKNRIIALLWFEIINNYGYISKIVVDEKYQSKGYCSKLISIAKFMAIKYKLKHLELIVLNDNDNEKVIRCYTNANFINVKNTKKGKRMEYYIKQNVFENYVKDNKININSYVLKKLKKIYNIEQLNKYFMELKLLFPYKIHYLLKQMPIDIRFKNYKKIKYKIVDTNVKNNDITKIYEDKKYDITKIIEFTNENPLEIYHFNVISDIFTENCRVKAQIKNNSSLHTHFFNKSLIPEWLKINEATELTTKVLRDMLYYNTKQIELTNFKASVAYSLYTIFKPKKILDMSSGWGDRLLGAIAYDDKCGIDYYYGVDPNVCLIKGYEKIKEISKNKHKFVMINECFEKMKFDVKFDLMFSSPPYFDYEKYTFDKTQSVIQYNNVKSWLTNFMYKSVDIIYDALNNGGYLCLNISDTGKIPYVHHILNYISRKFVYKYTIGYKAVSSVRPIYVFQKL